MNRREMTFSLLAFSATGCGAETIKKTPNELLVEQEANKLAITPQQKEAETILWKDRPRPNRPRFPVDEASFPAARSATEIRIRRTLALMDQSRNRKIKLAHTSLNQEGVRIRVIGLLQNQQGREIAMRIDPEEENGIRWYMGVSANQVVNELDGMLVVFELVHMAASLQYVKSYIQTLPPSLSPAEKIADLRKTMADPNELAQALAFAYAEQAEAYIFAYALGNTVGRGRSYERYAAEFIRTGRNWRDSRWINFIRREQGTSYS